MLYKKWKEEVLSIEHLKDIFLLLEKHGILDYLEICEYLNLTESTFVEIMEKYNLRLLICSSKSGRHILYRLTDIGREVAWELEK